MTPADQNRLWHWINAYAMTCGGDPSEHVYGNTPRQTAVAEIGKTIADAEADGVFAGFLRRTARGGSVVSSAAMTPWQIAIARAADRMLVAPDGLGFVYVPGPHFAKSDAFREQVASIMAVHEHGDEGPEGTMGPRWVLKQIALLLGPECSICRRRHGREVEHVAE
jgi:hypothetical protein